jgi:prepilin-type N-terminal cleavage/methylation domain-containing protein
MRIKARRRLGFTLVEIMIVVAIVGLLATIAIPSYVHARTNSQINACINNLRQIDAAKQEWALEQGKTTGDTPVQSDIQPYLGRGSNGTLGNVVCPLVMPRIGFAGYDINSVGTPPDCQQYNPTTHPVLFQ